MLLEYGHRFNDWIGWRAGRRLTRSIDRFRMIYLPLKLRDFSDLLCPAGGRSATLSIAVFLLQK